MSKLSKLQRFTQQRFLVIILALALVVRIGVAVWLGDKMEVIPIGGTHDQISYDTLAHRFAAGYGFTYPVGWYPWVPPDTPTSYYSGTMVLHLGIIYYLFGYHPLIPRLLYAVVGTFSCFLIYRIGARLFGKRAGIVAAALAAGYAYLVLYSGMLLTETPFILSVLLALETAYRLTERFSLGRLVGFSVAAAGAILFRVAIAPFVAVLLLWGFWKLRFENKGVAAEGARMSVWHVLIPVGVIGLAIMPWTLRNYLLYDRFMLLESQFGHVFWNANHPGQGESFDEVGWVAPIPEELKSLNEAELTYALLERGMQFVRDDPIRYLKLSLSRFKIFFMFWPSPDSGLMSNVARVLSFGICLPFMLYGLVRSLSHWRQTLPLYLFLVIHCGVYLASWVMIRYRIPADAVLLVFAGYGLVDLYEKVAPRLKPRRQLEA
ncbi:MAG: glycosyltransferase family 39 protein [Anaerolineae bacterium]|nr:glycosyltransferase family 39 protein [Anaerolineae bacterium]